MLPWLVGLVAGSKYFALRQLKYFQKRLVYWWAPKPWAQVAATALCPTYCPQTGAIVRHLRCLFYSCRQVWVAVQKHLNSLKLYFASGLEMAVNRELVHIVVELVRKSSTCGNSNRFPFSN